MAHVITKYIVYNHNGTGVRHHHFNASNNITTVTDENYPGTTDDNPGSGIAEDGPHYRLEGTIFHLLLCQ